MREHVEPAIDPSSESALATDDRRKAGARAEFSFMAKFTAATLHASAAIEDASDGQDEKSRQRAQPPSPQTHAQSSAGKQTAHNLRHTQAQRQHAQHERHQQRSNAPPYRRLRACPTDDTRNQACGEKSAPLAHAQAPAHAQNLVLVGIAQGMVGEAVKGVRPPSQPINPSR
jgi:hypothetical protein